MSAIDQFSHIYRMSATSSLESYDLDTLHVSLPKEVAVMLRYLSFVVAVGCVTRASLK